MWRPHISLLDAISVLVLIAAVILGVSSFRYAAQLAERSETSLIESNRLLGAQTIERIENFIIDSDRAMFDLVDLEHISDFSRVWSYIVRTSPAVEAALVLNEQLELVPGGYVSKRHSSEAEAFVSRFLREIVPDLPLGDLKPNLHKHFHKQYGGRDVLISFIKRVEKSRTYYVVLKISTEYILRRLFPDVLEPLHGKVLYCVRDSNDRVIFGEPFGRAGPFFYQGWFPTTLYLWRMELAPLPAQSLNAATFTRKFLAYLFVTLTLIVLVAGTVFVLYANAKERRTNQLRSDFVSNVSHELKTPLSLIRMFGELLTLGKLRNEEQGRQYAEIITRESERLSQLIDNVLDFSSIERGRAAYNFRPARFDDVVERSLDVYRHRVEREGFELVTNIEPNLPVVHIDESAMTLLLLNLLENAVKYGVRPTSSLAKSNLPVGKITVDIRQRPGFIDLSVSDEGPGILINERHKIFERFYRTPQARQTSIRGSGIGLALVKHIVEAHSGTVEVTDAPRAGARFVISIPLPVNEASA